jgi:hypothetical protein
MSVNQSNTPIDSLDFDDIKENLKNYLRGQELFKDYDFEGSTLSIVLDLLAYNTHYQAYYANMAANENFIDSAVLRPSIVSIAKHLNYIPRSTKAAQLLVDVKFNENITTEVVAGKAYLDRGTIFTGKNSDGKTVQFVNRETYKILRRRSENIVENLLLYQGYLKEVSYVANTQMDPDIRFVIPDISVDIDTLEIFVQKSQNETIGGLIPWKRATDINMVDGESRVFFVQNNRNGFWEVYFGDGIVGRAIQNGNLVSLRYLVTEGPNGNGVGYNDSSVLRSITSTDPRVTSGGEVRIRTNSSTGKPIVSFGGRNSETTESIRLYAPRNYQAQDRAVTAEDYRALLGKEYSDRADSFYIWGGEENDPPQYGKVFISVKPKVGTRLSQQEKQAIERTILGSKNLLTITPEIVDPDVLYINPSVTVYYDEAKTTLNRIAIEANVKDLVRTYSRTFLGIFDANFRTSNFTSVMDGISNTINSSNVTITLSKRIEPNLSRPTPYTIKFDNPLLHPIDGYTPILSSDVFGYRDLTSTAQIKPLVDCFLEDDGFGNVRIYKVVGSRKVTVVRNIGTIDYATGTVFLRNFFPEYLLTGKVELTITVIPDAKDIFARRNQIILIEEDNIQATAIPEKTRIDRNASDAAFPS